MEAMLDNYGRDATLQRDFGCPSRGEDNGLTIRCQLPDANAHTVHVSTETGHTLTWHADVPRDFDHEG